MKNYLDILYFSSSFGIMSFESLMNLIGLKQYQDFYGVLAEFDRSKRNFDHIIYTDKPQMLITSWLLFEPTIELAVEHIKNLRIKNPQLVVVNYFSGHPTNEKCFDQEINICLPGSIQALFEVVQDFLSGKLRHNVL